MSSRSDSDSESNRSASPINNGPAPTPGHGLDRSASNSPQYTRSQNASPERAASRSSGSSSARSRSPSVESNKSTASQRTAASNTSRKSRSRSVASNRSRGSQSPESNRSGSAGSQKTQRSGSNRSESPPGSRRSRSSSAGSKKSRSRSGSAGSKKSRSRSGSAGSKKSRSRSGSAASNKSGSAASSKSRSRSGSAASNRSKSAESNRSKSAESNRSRRSRSQSQEKRAESQDRSRSNSPNLQIDEPGSPDSGKGDKRKRDSSEERATKKKHRIIDSDSEGEEGKENDKEVSAAAIFGDDADDISSEEEKEKAESEKEAQVSEEEQHHSEIENEQRQPDEDEDKENEPEQIPETRIDVEIPKISCDLGRDIHFVKLPNFLSVETRPFDPETYEDEIDEEETLDEEGRARLKLKVENTIRWRENMDKEGNVKKESNARLVRWSDGSYSLHLGSEIFDVYKQPLQGDHNHLFIRQGTGLQGQAVFRTKLSFRPHSTESFTHRKMTLSLADRSQKTSGIKILSQVGADPDHDRKLLLKKEEEKLRQTVRVSKPRRKGDSGTRLHNSSVYREEDGSDEEGAISLNAIKNKYKSGAATVAKGGAIYSSDEEGSDIEARRARKIDKAKALKDSESSEESE
ncbi:another transcription unit protein [Tribolium madens]|uniref:another transcription unit protein n=1 Tax=Tribolium madens TaxID=41895 RepID=UPI001CF75FF4|nr:another transcription unit protein [Tribolium madens]